MRWSYIQFLLCTNSSYSTSQSSRSGDPELQFVLQEIFFYSTINNYVCLSLYSHIFSNTFEHQY